MVFVCGKPINYYYYKNLTIFFWLLCFCIQNKYKFFFFWLLVFFFFFLARNTTTDYRFEQIMFPDTFDFTKKVSTNWFQILICCQSLFNCTYILLVFFYFSHIFKCLRRTSFSKPKKFLVIVQIYLHITYQQSLRTVKT